MRMSKTEKWLLAVFGFIFMIWVVVAASLATVLVKSASYLKHNGLKGTVDTIWHGEKLDKPRGNERSIDGGNPA